MQLSGFIIDQATAYPLPGASVVIQGRGIGMATDNGGHYFFNDASITPADNILITYSGYIPATVPVDYVARQNAIGEDVATALQLAAPVNLPGVIVTNSPGPLPKTAGFTASDLLTYGLVAALLYGVFKKQMHR